MIENLFGIAATCLEEAGVDQKVRRTRDAAERWRDGSLAMVRGGAPLPIDQPGRPPRPVLVAPRVLPKRSVHTVEGRAALIHAVAHIEFNAINLAWDAVYRFRDLPTPYYDDWVRVADEEAYHFTLLRERLHKMNYEYGDFSAHNGLWEMAQDTAHDPLVRMALVPRVLEARGLDVTPGMIARLRSADDEETVALLGIILQDEIGHVEIGSRWFHFLCEQRGLAPGPTFRELIDRYMKGRIKGPFHHAARLQAGFTADELSALESLATGEQ